MGKTNATVRPSLFLVHAGDGNISHYTGLTPLLRPYADVYYLQASGIAEGTTPLDSVEEMSAYYLQAVRSTQPCGPYFIGAYSFGAQTAFEMARQLACAGEKVSLCFIDAFCIYDVPPPSEKLYFQMFLRDFLGLVSAERPLLRLIPQWGKTLAAGVLGSLLGLVPAGPRWKALEFISYRVGGRSWRLSPQQIQRTLATYISINNAVMRYRPQTCPVRLLLLRGERNRIDWFSHLSLRLLGDETLTQAMNQFRQNLQQRDYGWGQFTAAVDVRRVNANHYEMLKHDALPQVAASMIDWLREEASL
ncbi:alpha/beta fold hydrolase [Enterobacter sp. PGRG2]|uniref:thioesterase domain-containing protein n=1 Tax=Enterobacter sp. PGRG2 TaxID=3104013 RepID=UPI002ABE03FB|nr:alpha/beta fold hydrolase [Enterobacter sp. PGRG2]WJD51067.1 alpha/beta fold hydrolase [Enterobacter sp. PGRG2]